MTINLLATRARLLVLCGLCVSMFLAACQPSVEEPALSGFRAYVANQLETTDNTAAAAAEKFLAQQALSDAENKAIYRWLGLYTRDTYGQAALEDLAELVAIPSFRSPNFAQHENPAFIQLGEAVGALAQEFGLAFRNVDNRVYEITLPGATDELVGIHAHGDVVQVNPANWVLDDGTQLDPFTVTQIENRLYGRGTEDDKNGIIVSLYAMKVIKEEGLPLQRTFRLLVDTTEETTGDAIPYYFERNPTPAYNLALDGGYPVVIAEKGYGTVMASFPVRSGVGNAAEPVAVTGGLATNQIPKTATLLAITENPQDLVAAIESLAPEFIAGVGGEFSILAEASGDGVVITVTGVSAHSSAPETGVNPVSRLMLLINQMVRMELLNENHITDAATYATELWGVNYYGEQLDLAFAHDFMGPMTASQTFIGISETKLKTAVNLRVPVGRSVSELKAEIEGKIATWVTPREMLVDIDVSIAEPMYRNPEGKWVNALLDVATEILDLPREFESSAGATSVHYLPNGVQFGLSMPGVKYTGHNANEFKTVDQFMLDLQVVTEMMITVGQLPEL